MSRSKKSRRGKRMEQMQFDRHPQSRAEVVTSTRAITPSDCLNIIKGMFTPPLYTELVFSPLAWVKINCFINIIGSLEVTGFGKVEDGVVTDIKLIKQNVKSAYVECTPEAVMEFMREVGSDEISKWVLDWHSHVNMGVTASGTDWNNYEQMYQLRGGQFPFLIINKSQVTNCQNYRGNKATNSISLTVPKEEIYGVYTMDEIIEIYDQCEQEILLKCIEDAPKAYTTTSYYEGGYGGGSYYNTKKVPTDKVTTLPSSVQKITKVVPKDDQPLCWKCDNVLTTAVELNDRICNACTAKAIKDSINENKCYYCDNQLVTEQEKTDQVCDSCMAEYYKESARGTEVKSDPVQNETECCLCAGELKTAEELEKNVCSECEQRYKVEPIKKCRACDSELAYPEEEQQGFCYDCLAQAHQKN